MSTNKCLNIILKCLEKNKKSPEDVLFVTCGDETWLTWSEIAKGLPPNEVTHIIGRGGQWWLERKEENSGGEPLWEYFESRQQVPAMYNLQIDLRKRIT